METIFIETGIDLPVYTMCRHIKCSFKFCGRGVLNAQ